MLGCYSCRTNCDACQKKKRSWARSATTKKKINKQEQQENSRLSSHSSKRSLSFKVGSAGGQILRERYNMIVKQRLPKQRVDDYFVSFALLFVGGCHTNRDDVAVITKTVLLLRVQTAGISALGWTSWKWKCKTCRFLRAWGCSHRKTGSLTESDDGQDDGDRYGHPGHPQGLLAVTLGFVGLQAHAAFQETYRKNSTGHGDPTATWLRKRSKLENERSNWAQHPFTSRWYRTQLVITGYKL